MERFLKSTSKVWTIVHAQNHTVSKCAYESLEQERHHVSGRVTRFLVLESIFDAFKPIQDALLEFHKTHEPTLYEVFLSIQYCIREMERVEHGVVELSAVLHLMLSHYFLSVPVDFWFPVISV